jgi:hypothetical protein
MNWTGIKMKSDWTRIYKSAIRPIYIYKSERGYKVNAYSFYPRYFNQDNAKQDCLDYVNSFGEGITNLV